MKNSKNEKGKNFSKYIVWIVIAIVLIWIFIGILPYFILPFWENRGSFGDMFGAVNSLFSALAFCGIIYTIYLQKTELELQRQELVATREQLFRAADAQEKSEKALNQQVNFMHLTAKLNALNSLMKYYEDISKYSDASNPFANEMKIQAKKKYFEKIEKVLQDIEILMEKS